MQRILVVDDELGPRESLRMILKSAYQVTTASSGPEALQRIREARPDLVFLDIKMRGMNGIEVLKTIKETDPDIDVIMMTAYASFETARVAMTHSALDYLIKPFGKHEVEKAVENALARRQQRAGARQEVRVLLEQMRALTQASTPGTSGLHVRHTLSDVLRIGKRLLQATAILLYSSDAAETRLTRQVVLGMPSSAMETLEGPEWCSWFTQVVAESRPVLVSAGSSLQREAGQGAHAMRALGYDAGVFFPVSVGQQGSGVLAFLYDAAPAPADWRDMGQLFTEIVVFALHVHQQYRTSTREASRQAQRVAQLSILREISRVIVEKLEPQEMLRAIEEQLRVGLGYSGFHVWLQDGAQAPLRAVYSSGPDEGWQPSETAPAIPAELQVDTVAGHQVVLAPVVLDGSPVGVIKLARAIQQHVTEPEIELIRMLLDYISIAVKNTRLYSEMKATKNYLENLINDAGDGIVTVNTADVITSWNASAERIFHYAPDESLRQDVSMLFPPDLYAQWRRQVVELGLVKHLETCLRRRDGTPVDVSLTLSPLRGPRDEVVGLSAIIKDVTEDKRLREQLLQSEKLRALGEMAAGVAHNFNNILTTILGRTQLLLAFPEDEQTMREGLGIIEKATRDAAHVVRRIQTFAQSGVRAERVPADLNPVVLEAVEITRPIWDEGSGHRIEITQRLEVLPTVMCRPTEIREVLTNLLLNAVDAMPDGGAIHLSTRRDRQGVRIVVTDTGCGMPENLLHRIFDPFFSTKAGKGTGLGLSVSHTLIKGHGGNIEVQSTPGHGTTFVVTLPVGA